MFSLGQFYSFNGKVLFTRDSDVHRTELWSADGAVAGTVLLADIMPGGRDGGNCAATGADQVPKTWLKTNCSMKQGRECSLHAIPEAS